ncbi:hypothetical protein [Frankia sp. R82]|uniref:hypothetical protein n=1 Tax=Frankia sp. R82 TaxID=2950553 RepID=UPI00204441E9|nr:hypothetical protein [Frankia sp. R82]MCM3885312.1 hypothetical protein [Frankia sp. R82]
MTRLIPSTELPSGFCYPAEYLRVVDLGLTNLEPWLLMDGEALLQANNSLRSRFPQADLVPFAVRRDTDDLACWEASSGEVVLVRHRRCGSPMPGPALRGRFEDFHGWLLQAVTNLARFDG